MKLENSNLVELNAQEVQEVEGGIIPLILAVMLVDAFAIGTFAGLAYQAHKANH